VTSLPVRPSENPRRVLSPGFFPSPEIDIDSREEVVTINLILRDGIFIETIPVRRRPTPEERVKSDSPRDRRLP
jgi:hypothetical protein